MGTTKQIQKGKRIIFKYEKDGAGDMSDQEKAGRIIGIGDMDRPFPIKVGLMNVEDKIVTYIHPSEVLRIID